MRFIESIIDTAVCYEMGGIAAFWGKGRGGVAVVKYVSSENLREILAFFTFTHHESREALRRKGACREALITCTFKWWLQMP